MNGNEMRKRNRGMFARSMDVVNYVHRVGRTTVAQIARDLNMSVRQVFRDLQYVKFFYNIETKPGRAGGVFWTNEGVFPDLDEPRQKLQKYWDALLGTADAIKSINILQWLDYESQEYMFRTQLKICSCLEAQIAQLSIEEEDK